MNIPETAAVSGILLLCSGLMVLQIIKLWHLL